MFIPAKISKYLQRLQQCTKRLKFALHRYQYSTEIDWPQNTPRIPCRVEVITWNRYLSDEIRDALLELYPCPQTDAGAKAAAKWLNSRSLKEKIRIEHFDWTYTSYTVPDWPSYWVWLPSEEIQTRIFPSPVPTFMAIEYDYIQKAARNWHADPSKVRDLLFEEEIMLSTSQLFWKAKHYANFQFYKTLPYNIQERKSHGRSVYRS